MSPESEDLDLAAETVRRFGEHVQAVLFSGDAPDGNLDAVPDLIAEAAGMDILADAGPLRAGHEIGVWGRHILREGCRLSLLTLSMLGEVCAGLATAVHAQGIGALALDGSECVPSGATVGAGFLPAFGLALDRRTAPDVLHIERDAGGKHLKGRAHFILASGRPDWLVCFARDEGANGWAALAIPASGRGINLEQVGSRLGLRAVSQWHVTCDRASVADEWVLVEGSDASGLLSRVMACDWLGQAAIALGAARRAVHDARDYAGGRYQGGRMIIEHAAIRLLLAQAEHDTALLASVLDEHADRPLDSQRPEDLLRWAIGARLAVGEHAQRAVTNCLQVFGGYGYMDDYGLSKRLRDVGVLASLHGGPDQLLLLLEDMASPGGDR